ncbi:MAG: carbamoyltransferase [Hyphomicrobiaceae bacterium]|nr:carbamoyltransferase [Hyphomicrobiaceae bacterium]
MADKPIYVLGLNVYDHDVAACLLRDGEIAFAIEKERVTREKHATGFYQEVIEYCLQAEGIKIGDVDLVVRNCYILPVEEMEDRLMYQDAPNFLTAEEREQAASHPHFLSNSDKVITISHHLAHAYSAFAASPYDEGAVMIVDGVGSYCADVMEPDPTDPKPNPLSRESESYYTFKDTELTTLKKVYMTPSRGFFSDDFFNMPGLGALYSRVSSYIFGDWNKCGEVMGLAPYGRPNVMKPLLEMRGEDLVVPPWSRAFNKPWFESSDTDWEKSPAMQHYRDLAWQVQDDTENVLLARTRWLKEKTGAKNLVVAGGVALNCVANGRLVRESGFENIWFQPAAGDNGIALGCAYYGYLSVLNKPRPEKMKLKHAYLGRPYSEDEVDTALSKAFTKFETKQEHPDDICKEAARLLAEGNIFAWVQGRSEFGPRALGNRSILADPRSADVKDTLNRRVKFRQAFRPFAPIVLRERVDEVFEGDEESPYMLVVKRVRPEWKDRIAGIVHVDGTARVQTVIEETNPKLYRLLKEFEAITGVPVLVNTSLNVRGEPIVESPEDAVNCFLGTDIDYLAIHDRLVSKAWAHRFISPVGKVYNDIKSIVRAGME